MTPARTPSRPLRPLSLAPTLAATLVVLLAMAGCKSSPTAADRTAESKEVIRLLGEADKLTREGIAMDTRRARAEDRDALITPRDGQEKFNQAEQKLLAVIALNNNIAAAWNDLGWLYMQRNDFYQAKPAFLRASEIEPTIAQPLYNIALCYDLRGYSRLALDYYARALARQPQDRDSLRGAIQSADVLRIADQATLDRIATALEVETEEPWLNYFQQQLYRVSEALERRERSTPPRALSPVPTPAPNTNPA